VVPESAADYQTLMDNLYTMNFNCPILGEASADDYYLTTTIWQSLPIINRMAYIWDTAVFVPKSLPNEWSYAYQKIYSANVVLDNIDKVPKTAKNESDWNNTKGSALFFRAKTFLEGAIIWAKAYNPVSAKQDLGLPLRLTSDFNVRSVRANVQDTYDRIIKDLKEAIFLLPESTISVLRPSRPAAYGLLGRAYLSMGEYDSAFKYSDLCLQLRNQLMDFNTIDAAVPFPVPLFNVEDIMHSRMDFSYPSPVFVYGKVDSMLYDSYSLNDLRKSVYFKMNPDSSYYFAGSYVGSYNLYNGLATDEVYLTRAECFARLGNTASALSDVNKLLQSRWRTGTFIPVAAGSPEEALKLILTERRKELIFRGLRWMDIKRLNQEGAGIVLTRVINDQTYTLAPNDNKYARPLPDDVLDLSGMPQNP
jgi:tetratricopeptide (TPR) repeat protein